MFERLWCLHDAEPRGGPLNMAIDELALERAASTARPLLRTYRWAEPCVSIGYFDRIDVVEEQFPNRPLVRRWTGGGAVDHRDDYTFTLAMPGAHPSASWSAARRYLAIHACVSAALSQLGVAAESVGRERTALKLPAPAPCFAAPVCGDLMANGRKIVGGAQRRTRYGVLHQGSIQNLPAWIDWPALEPALATAFGGASEKTGLDAEWLRRAAALADAKYGTNEWLRAR